MFLKKKSKRLLWYKKANSRYHCENRRKLSPKAIFLLKDKRGIVLIACYLVIVALLILGSAFLTQSITEKRIAERERDSLQAFWLAEAGMDQGLARLRAQGSGENPDAQSLGAGSYDYQTLDLAGGRFRIVSTGTIQDSSRQLVMEVQADSAESLFTKALLAQGLLFMHGSVVVDSYNSDNGPYGAGNIGSNGDIASNGGEDDIVKLGGSVMVNGDVGTGPGGTIWKRGSVTINGDEDDDIEQVFPAVTVPQGLTGLDSGGSLILSGSGTYELPPGDYKFSKIQLSGSRQLNVEGPARIYLTDSTSLKTTGSSRINTNGPVEVYIDGSAQFRGSGIVNQSGIPSNLYLYGTGTSTEISWSGSSMFSGAVYAPNAEINITGNSTIYGAFVGDSVMDHGSTAVRYDEALASTTPAWEESSSYTILSWQEQ